MIIDTTKIEFIQRFNIKDRETGLSSTNNDSKFNIGLELNMNSKTIINLYCDKSIIEDVTRNLTNGMKCIETFDTVLNFEEYINNGLMDVFVEYV